MRQILLATAAGLALIASAQAQTLPPFQYGDPYGNFVQPIPVQPPSFEINPAIYVTPAVPQIPPTFANPPPGPSGYPCTMPGCR